MLPTISIVIPTYNSQDYIKKCLDSIFMQNYPKNKLQVLIVNSTATTDNTVQIANKYPVKIISNPKRLAEPAKTLGFKHATGEMFFYLDSDAELVSKNWLKKIVKPLVENKELAGSFTRYLPNSNQSAFNRYVSYNPLQLWSMLSFLLPSVKESTISKHKGYDIIKIIPEKSPPVGIALYRKRLLDKFIKNPDKYNYVDIAISLELAELGHDQLAYVEDAGLYHQRSGLIKELKRQKRDVAVTYLPVIGKRKFNYIDFNNSFDLLKIVSWVIYVNLIMPSLLVGAYKAVKHKDFAGLYELPTNFLLTNYIVYLFLSEKNGRKLIKNILLKKA